jgi:hypothetical protein
MFTLQTDTGWGALGRTSGAHTQGKKLRRHDGKVGELGCSSMGRRQRALPRGECRRQGQQAISGRKFPVLDRQMSSRITAPAHTVGAVVFSSTQEGLVRVEMDSWRRVNYGQASGVSVLDEPHAPRTNAVCGSRGGFEKQRAGTKHPWADLRLQCGMSTGAATIAPFWASQDFWTLAGAVRQWLCKTAAGRSVARRPRSASHREQAAGEDEQNYTLEEQG